MRDRTWRERDLRQAQGPVPATVGSVVQRTHFALGGARLGEGVLIGVGAMMITLAAHALAGGDAQHVEAWFVALLCGALCGITWRMEHRQSSHDVARALDDRLRHQGGLVTAYELEAQADNSPMGRLLVSRVLVRLRTREALRAMFPPLALPVAAPILGVACLALALEFAPREDEAVEISGLATGMAATLDAVERELLDAGAGDGLAHDVERELLAIARQARDVQRRADRGQADPKEVERALDELEGALHDVAPKVAQDARMRALVDDARNWLDAARMEVASAADGSGAEGGAGAGADEAGGSSAPPGAGSVTPAAPDGTMSTPPDSAVESMSPQARGDSGTVAGRTWPAEYDAIVAGWIESRRRASDPPFPKEEF